MRTTLDITDHLLMLAKEQALKERTSLRAVVEQALSRLLLSPEPASKAAPSAFRFPVMDGRGGVAPELLPEKTSSLLMEDNAEEQLRRAVAADAPASYALAKKV